MARRPKTSGGQRRPLPIQEYQGRPQGVAKKGLQPLRRSARIEATSRSRQGGSIRPIQNRFGLSDESHLQPPQPRKRLRGVESPAPHISAERSQKRRCILCLAPTLQQGFDQHVEIDDSISKRSHVSHWIEAKDWPAEFFQNTAMDHLLARKKSAATLRRKRSEGSFAVSTTSSDQRTEEEKSAPYKNPEYSTLLESLGDSYMSEEDKDQVLTNECEKLYSMLLNTKQTPPRDTIFRDDVFRTTCNKLQGKKEARIVKDLTPLLVPSVEPRAILGARHLDTLVESVNEGWNSRIPVTKSRPQPDYAVGFGQAAFSEAELEKLSPYIGDPSDRSYFKATYYMYLPLLTCEVKCGAVGLDIADRQNAHSMAVAMTGIIELFKRVGREQELHRRLLGFSFSQENESMRIWAHYSVVTKDKIMSRRFSTRKFDFTERRGAEKWTAWTFTTNIYDIWVTPPLKWIRSAIDDLPLQQELEVTQQDLNLSSAPSNLSQRMEKSALSQEAGDQSNRSDLRPITPDTSTESALKSKRTKKI